MIYHSNCVLLHHVVIVSAPALDDTTRVNQKERNMVHRKFSKKSLVLFSYCFPLFFFPEKTLYIFIFVLCSSFFSVSKLQNHEKKRDFKKSLFCTPCSRRWSKINWDFVLLNNKTFFQLGTVFCQNMFLVVKIFLTSPSYTFYKQLLLSHEL